VSSAWLFCGAPATVCVGDVFCRPISAQVINSITFITLFGIIAIIDAIMKIILV